MSGNKLELVKNAPRKTVGGVEKRASSFSIIDDEATDRKYLPLIGMDGVGLYTVLVRATGSSFEPTEHSIAALFFNSAKVTQAQAVKVHRVLNKLKKVGLIEVKKTGYVYSEALGKSVPVYTYSVYEVPKNLAAAVEQATEPEQRKPIVRAAAIEQAPVVHQQATQQPAAQPHNVQTERMAAIEKIAAQQGCSSSKQKERLIEALQQFRRDVGRNAMAKEIEYIAMLVSGDESVLLTDYIKQKAALK
nr:hypothetical protein [Phascolarctobacterium succinatutens]